MEKESKHSLNLIDRKTLFLQGAKDIASFDEKTIVVVTNLGQLSIKGEELHIKALNLEEERLEVSGFINMLAYSDGKGKSMRKNNEGILKRLLK